MLAPKIQPLHQYSDHIWKMLTNWKPGVIEFSCLLAMLFCESCHHRTGSTATSTTGMEKAIERALSQVAVSLNDRSAARSRKQLMNSVAQSLSRILEIRCMCSKHLVYNRPYLTGFSPEIYKQYDFECQRLSKLLEVQNNSSGNSSDEKSQSD